MIVRYLHDDDLHITKDICKKYIAIVGSRGVNNYEIFKQYVSNILLNFLKFPKEEIIIVSGGAKGADNLAEIYAHEQRINMIVINANWKKYGKKAGFLRNKTVADLCDYCIAFLTSSSKGTIDTIKKVNNLRKKLFIVDYGGLPDELQKIKFNKGVLQIV